MTKQKSHQKLRTSISAKGEQKSKVHHHHDIKKLANLIKDIKVGMLTTVDKDGKLHSRPMATQQFEFDGRLWFMTSEVSPKVCELLHENHVNVTYSGRNNSYVSVFGIAHLIFDRDKIKEIWNPTYKAWFPHGVDDPNLALIEVEVLQAEYWESPPSAVVKLMGFAKYVLTGEGLDTEGGKKLDLAG